MPCTYGFKGVYGVQEKLRKYFTPKPDYTFRVIYFLPLSFSLPHAAFKLNVVAKSEVGLGSGCFLLLLRFAGGWL